MGYMDSRYNPVIYNAGSNDSGVILRALKTAGADAHGTRYS